MCAGACMHAYTGPEADVRCPPQLFAAPPPFFLRQSFSLKLSHGFGQTSWAAIPNNPPVSTSSVPGLQVCTATPGVYFRLGDGNSGLQFHTEGV